MALQMRAMPAAIFLLALCILPRTSLAQSQAEFVAAFSGDWLIFDPVYGDQEPCKVSLGTYKQGELYAANTTNCQEPISNITDWTIADNQLLFFAADRVLLVRLGGNQRRISGETLEDAGIVMERPGSFQTATEPNCVYRGYTTDCATDQDLRKPIETSELSKEAQVRVLVNLNVRREPRPDAEILSQLAPQACVQITQCLTASDGNWCKASVDNQSGWIVQEAIRQRQWRTLTFAPGC